MKIFLLLTALLFGQIPIISAQDFIVKSNDEVIRGTIKGTDYFSVFISVNDKADVILEAKNVKNFFWNGNTYFSKGFANKNNFEYRFVKAIEIGAVNLYVFGGESLIPIQNEKRVRFRPSIGVGTGTGGFGGMGVGGGISIGGGRNSGPERRAGAPVVRYFIEKPGVGALQEIPIKAITPIDKKAEVKTILLQKLGDQASLKAKIEANSDLNSTDVISFVKEYNAAKQ